MPVRHGQRHPPARTIPWRPRHDRAPAARRRPTSRDKTIDRTGFSGFAALLRKAQVQHADGFEIFVVFDSEDGSQARAGQESDYKAQRPAPEPGLIESLSLIKDALDHSCVGRIEQDGFEADDVIAPLATAARTDGRAVDIMTTDKDYINSWPTPACAC
ncbi:hypothetical protein AB0F30_35610 [Streptomyces sp. NPDC029006]|uniref:hypothetical protein n=1 Tax=Streptomyces sp. NPDC029006 TaxID=3155467 RepID=UPI00340D10C4